MLPSVSRKPKVSFFHGGALQAPTFAVIKPAKRSVKLRIGNYPSPRVRYSGSLGFGVPHPRACREWNRNMGTLRNANEKWRTLNTVRPRMRRRENKQAIAQNIGDNPVKKRGELHA